MYEMICLMICVFAVFGGYVALRVAAHAMLRRLSRAKECDGTSCGECGCSGCTGYTECPIKGTDREAGAEKD